MDPGSRTQQEKVKTCQNPSVKTGRGYLLFQMKRHQHKATQILKNQTNMTPPKETNKAPVTDPKETEIYKFPDKEFKIRVLKKLSKVQ